MKRLILTYIRTINKQKSTEYSVLLLITSEWKIKILCEFRGLLKRPRHRLMSRYNYGYLLPHALSHRNVSLSHKLLHHRFLKWFEMPLKAVQLSALVLVDVAQKCHNAIDFRQTNHPIFWIICHSNIAVNCHKMMFTGTG